MKKNIDTSKLIANLIMTVIVLISIGFVCTFLLSVPALLVYVGIEYTSKWSLLKFSLGIIFVDYCLEGLKKVILNKMNISRSKCRTVMEFVVEVGILTMITFAIGDLMTSVQLSIMGALFFSTLLTLLVKMTELLVGSDEDEK